MNTKLDMSYWYGRLAQLNRDGGTEFVLTPTEWFQLCKQMDGMVPGINPPLMFGRPIRVSWESEIPCPHCGRLPNDPPPQP